MAARSSSIIVTVELREQPPPWPCPELTPSNHRPAVDDALELGLREASGRLWWWWWLLLLLLLLPAAEEEDDESGWRAAAVDQIEGPDGALASPGPDGGAGDRGNGAAADEEDGNGLAMAGAGGRPFGMMVLALAVLAAAAAAVAAAAGGAKGWDRPPEKTTGSRMLVLYCSFTYWQVKGQGPDGFRSGDLLHWIFDWNWRLRLLAAARESEARFKNRWLKNRD